MGGPCFTSSGGTEAWIIEALLVIKRNDVSSPRAARDPADASTRTDESLSVQSGPDCHPIGPVRVGVPPVAALATRRSSGLPPLTIDPTD
jgi:hypothetical protein